MKVIVLGGGGAMSRATISDLLSGDDFSSVVAADRDRGALEKLQTNINDKRFSIAMADLNDEEGTAELIKGAAVVINAAWYEYNIHAMRAAMKVGVPLIDLGGLYHMTKKQLAMHEEVKAAGILVIPGMGSDPGTSNILCRHGVDMLDQVEEIHIRYGSNAIGSSFPFAIATVINEVVQDAVVVRKGEFHDIVPLSESEDVPFRKEVGTQTCYSIIHSELASLRESFPGVQEITYKDSWDTDLIKTIKTFMHFQLTGEEPVETNIGTVIPKKMLVELLHHASKNLPADEPVDGFTVTDELMVVVKGLKDGLPTEIILEVVSQGDGEFGPIGYLTGIPPAIVARMIAKGQIKKTGVLAPENAINSDEYLSQLAQKKTNIYVSTKVTRELLVQ